MKKSIPILLVLLMLVLPLDAAAQTGVPALPYDPMMALPESEVVVTLDVKRILQEAVPRLLGQAPVARARFEAELEKLRAQTGFDVRGVERIVLGMGDFNVAPGSLGAKDAMPGRMVAVITGSFDAPVLVAAARLAMSGQYREEQYGGMTLHTFTLENKARQLSAAAVVPTDLSVVSLGPHAIAIGLPASVRAAIDIHQRSGVNTANADLIAMATNSPHALMSVGADLRSWTRRAPVRRKAAKELRIDPIDRLGSVETAGPATGATGPEAEYTKAFEAIRQVFFAAGMTPGTFHLHLVARAEGAEQVQTLNRMLTSLRETTGTVTDPRARRILDGMQFFMQGNEMQIRAEFAQSDIASLLTDQNLKVGRSGTATARRRPRRAP